MEFSEIACLLKKKETIINLKKAKLKSVKMDYNNFSTLNFFSINVSIKKEIAATIVFLKDYAKHPPANSFEKIMDKIKEKK